MRRWHSGVSGYEDSCCRHGLTGGSPSQTAGWQIKSCVRWYLKTEKETLPLEWRVNGSIFMSMGVHLNLRQTTSHFKLFSVDAPSHLQELGVGYFECSAMTTELCTALGKEISCIPCPDWTKPTRRKIEPNQLEGSEQWEEDLARKAHQLLWLLKKLRRNPITIQS